MTAAPLFEEALKLPQEEFEKLCDKLQNSLSSQQAAELARRIEAHRSHPEQVISREALDAKWGWKP